MPDTNLITVYTIGGGYHQQSRQETQGYTLSDVTKQIIVIGKMNHKLDGTFESANRVYDKKKCCPTIPTCGGGGIQPKVIKRWKK